MCSGWWPQLAGGEAAGNLIVFYHFPFERVTVVVVVVVIIVLQMRAISNVDWTIDTQIRVDMAMHCR